MTDPAYLGTPQGRRIAYRRTEGDGPGVIFLGGFKSDMKGTKAVALEDWAKREGRAFLRFDYSGHGESDGEFTAGCIGDWAEDAQAAISELTEGPQILVGSSMGGWIALRMVQERVLMRVKTGAALLLAAHQWSRYAKCRSSECAQQALCSMWDCRHPHHSKRKR